MIGEGEEGCVQGKEVINWMSWVRVRVCVVPRALDLKVSEAICVVSDSEGDPGRPSLSESSVLIGARSHPMYSMEGIGGVLGSRGSVRYLGLRSSSSSLLLGMRAESRATRSSSASIRGG